MKRDELLEHIQAEIEEALVSLENRPKTRPYAAIKLAENLLALLEGFNMVSYESEVEDEKEV